MAFNFQFAFLGWQHSYVASVTQVSTSEQQPLEPSDTACFRLPESYTGQFENLALTRYISNIRGHDFLCHTGRWTRTSENKSQSGYLPAHDKIINEIEALRILADQNKTKGFNRADLKLSLGAQPGSFFADAFQLGCYRWKELPNDLDDALQSEVRSKGKGYGDISDLAINALGGWVMNLAKEDDIIDVAKHVVKKIFRSSKTKPQFRWGGQIPILLEEALRQGLTRDAKIVHIFLNHQNPDEYVLLFNDGRAYVNLHEDFEKCIRRLADVWAMKRGKRLQWNFTYSCRCLEDEQRQLDAAYYNRRGRFYLSRKNCDLALSYIREAVLQDPDNRDIQDSQRVALVARRLWKNDYVLDRHLLRVQSQQIEPETYLRPHDSTADGWFRNQYMSLIKSPRHEAQLLAQLNRLTSLATGNGTQRCNGWSYSLASGSSGSFPIDIDLHVENDQNQDQNQDQDQDQYQHQNEHQNQGQNRTTAFGLLTEAELQDVPEPVELADTDTQRRYSELSGESQRRPSELSGDMYGVSPIQEDGQGEQNISIYGEDVVLGR